MTGFARNPLGWTIAVVAGVAAPALVLVLLPHAAAPAVAAGMMGSGMIVAALTGRLPSGFAAAALVGAGLLAAALASGLAGRPHAASLALALIAAPLSFAARGCLFARSLGARGWWMALFVVAGEAAILATAAALPGRLPGWLLALLPAQWASNAIRAGLGAPPTFASLAALLALAATAAATLFVARRWPRRWPYGVMFITWLAASALVLRTP